MSGGGSGRPISGRMNTDAQKARRRSSAVGALHYTESSISAKEKELADCESNLTKVRQRREYLEDTVLQLSQRIQEAQRVVVKCQVNLTCSWYLLPLLFFVLYFLP